MKATALGAERHLLSLVQRIEAEQIEFEEFRERYQDKPCVVTKFTLWPLPGNMILFTFQFDFANARQMAAVIKNRSC